MVKKFFGVILLVIFTFVFTMVTNTNLKAQEEERVEDVMDISLEDLLDVEITTAGKRAERVGDIPASVVVISRKDIETYGYQTLEEILGNIPGLYLTNDLFSTKVGIRGFWTERDNGNIIILVNNIAQPSELYSAYPLENIPIPVEAIDRIEVVRGPMSVIYGTGAFFGVINIKTNIVDEDGASMVSASGGSDETYKLFARAAGKIDDFQYTFNGSYLSTYGMNEPYDKMTDPSILPFLGVPTDHTTDGQLEETDKYFNFSGTFNDFYFDASYGEAQKEVIFLLPSFKEGTKGTYKSTRFGFGYKKDFSDQVTVDAKLVYFQNRWQWDFDWIFGALYGFEDDYTTAYRANLDLFFTPSSNLNITVGLDYYKILSVNSEIDVPMFELVNLEYNLAPGESITTQSIYSQIDFNLTKNLKLVLGARLEQMMEYDLQQKIGSPDPLDSSYSVSTQTYSETDPEFIPRVALIFSPNESNAIKLLYGKALTRPSFFQNQDLFGEGVEVSLLPETIQTFELNYLATLSKFSIGISVFHNILDSLIYRTQLLIEGIYQTYHANVGEMTTTGAEMTLQFVPSKSFFLELSGTYQDTKDKRSGFEDIEPGYSPKFLGYFKASVFFNNDISLAVLGNYVDKMESFWDESLGGRLGEQVDSYFLLGANFRARNLFGSGLFINARVSNLLDQEIHYPTTSNNDWASLGTLAKGRSFLFTLGYKFQPQP